MHLGAVRDPHRLGDHHDGLARKQGAQVGCAGAVPPARTGQERGQGRQVHVRLPGGGRGHDACGVLHDRLGQRELLRWQRGTPVVVDESVGRLGRAHVGRLRGHRAHRTGLAGDVGGPVDDDGRGERGRVRRVAEGEPAADVPDLRARAQDMLVPPRGISPHRDQGHDRGASRGRLPRLGHPRSDGAPIRGVHPHGPAQACGLSRPVLGQAIPAGRVGVVQGVVRWRLGVGGVGAHVQDEPELGIQAVEEVLRGGPLVGGRGQVGERGHRGSSRDAVITEPAGAGCRGGCP